MLRNILILVCFFILTGSENKPKWKSLLIGTNLDEATDELILYFRLRKILFNQTL